MKSSQASVENVLPDPVPMAYTMNLLHFALCSVFVIKKIDVSRGKCPVVWTLNASAYILRGGPPPLLPPFLSSSSPGQCQVGVCRPSRAPLFRSVLGSEAQNCHHHSSRCAQGRKGGGPEWTPSWLQTAPGRSRSLPWVRHSPRTLQTATSLPRSFCFWNSVVTSRVAHWHARAITARWNPFHNPRDAGDTSKHLQIGLMQYIYLCAQ